MQIQNLKTFSCNEYRQHQGLEARAFTTQQEHYNSASVPCVVHDAKDKLLYLGTALPLVSTIFLHDVTAQISRAFPLHICILQAIKDWKWEQPGKELWWNPETRITLYGPGL